MAKDSMIGIINRLISKRLNSLSMTDVVVGTITTLSPEVSITIMEGSDAIALPEELIDVDSLPADVQIGDKFRFLRYGEGTRFLALGQKIPEGNKKRWEEE